MNGKSDCCRLCLKPGELRFSHILPEFLYRPLYDEKHRLIALRAGETPANQGKPRLQKGIREYLLCTRCEGRLAKLETYAANAIRSLPDSPGRRSGTVLLIPGIDYSIFKLFQVSLLWRASVSSHATFQFVNLGPHEQILRRMLWQEDPGEPWEYGCLLIRPGGSEKLNAIKPPGPIRFQGHRGYQMILPGMIWTYIVSSHSDEIQARDSFLRRDGTLPVHVGTETAPTLLFRIGQSLRKAGILSD